MSEQNTAHGDPCPDYQPDEDLSSYELTAWLLHQIEHGHAPGGYPVEMHSLYAEGRRAAFEATLAFVRQVCSETEIGIELP